ncbi:hypothetical protein CO731_04966 [Aminobacter sp. MSH1]|uniref:hypothetical protein n=1 Tax=Aminobacter sp. MSH1 TaxID=374606 RepID=UPI000D349B9C|nr:hypothetical protein [Aminobacter sp. MSH1]AWC25469.1 hypothetical protein CO731_04966 [Aminobacter sp. MSH1]
MRFVGVMLGLLCLPLLLAAFLLTPVIIPALLVLRAVVPGFSAFRRTSSKSSWNLAAYHPPHSLTWRWLLSLRRHELMWLKPFAIANSFGFGAGVGTLFGFSAYKQPNGGWQWHFALLWHGLSFSQQEPMWYRDLYHRARDEADQLSGRAWFSDKHPNKVFVPPRATVSTPAAIQ